MENLNHPLMVEKNGKNKLHKLIGCLDVGTADMLGLSEFRKTLNAGGQHD